MLVKRQKLTRRCFRGVMVKTMDCGIVVSEFVFQLRYYVHFRANILVLNLVTPKTPYLVVEYSCSVNYPIWVTLLCPDDYD